MLCCMGRGNPHPIFRNIVKFYLFDYFYKKNSFLFT